MLTTCMSNNQFKSWSYSCTGLHYVHAKVLRCRFQASVKCAENNSKEVAERATYIYVCVFRGRVEGKEIEPEPLLGTFQHCVFLLSSFLIVCVKKNETDTTPRH